MRLGPFLLLFSVILMNGCGGGGGTTDPNPLIRSVTLSIDGTVGGSVSDAKTGITVTISPGTDLLPGFHPVTVNFYQHQPGGSVPPGVISTTEGVEVKIDPNLYSDSNPPVLTMPSLSTYDRIQTSAFTRDTSGGMHPLTITYDSGSNRISVVLPKTVSSNFSKQIAKPQIGIFNPIFFIATWGSLKSTIVAGGRFWEYTPVQGGAGTWNAAPSKMPTGRIAVIVHGMANQKDDMTDLARFISRDIQEYAGVPIYDKVWVYEYNWWAHIDENGDLFASALQSAIGPGTNVEIIAHSMGGLVSRWALEKRGMGSTIHKLTTLDTPNEGVPLGIIQLLVNVLLNEINIPVQGAIPGVEDLVVPLIDPFGTSFLNRLNSGDSPYKATANYYTSASTGYGRYGNFGVISESLYNPFSHVIDHDGIVPVYSANSAVLSSKSTSWSDLGNHTTILNLSHSEVNGDPDNTTGGCKGTNSSVQCRMENGIKDFILASVKGGVH